jgi:hypothetical protein
MHNRPTAEEKAFAKSEEARREEIERNPLIQYSTSQLKTELQRRKREGR